MSRMGSIIKVALWSGASWIMSFIVPLTPFLAFTVVLVLCDLYTGTRAARHRGEQINSRGLKRTIEKISLYFIAILLSNGMEAVFFLLKGWHTELTFVVSSIIALTEFKSNIENISAYTGAQIWPSIVDKMPDIMKLLKNKKQ